MSKLKIGFIGCGGIANDKHFPGMATQRDRIDMYAFCDIIPQRAQEACDKYGCQGAKVFADYRELLKDPDIFAVHVLTPNVKHCEISVAAMEAGKHVICEKPMAATYADAMKMYETHQRTGKLLTIGYQYRHMDQNKAMKAYVDTGALGEIYYAEATAWRRRGIPTWGVFTNKAEQGGGPLIDMATHALDLTLWMMGNYEVASVTGATFDKIGPVATVDEMGNDFGNWDPAKYELEDSAFGFVRMKNGALINVRCSWAMNIIPVEGMVRLCGTKGGVDANNGLVANHVVANRKVDTAIATRGFRPRVANTIDRNPMVMPDEAEAKIWVDALCGQGELFVTPEQALTVTKVLDAIYESARTGKTVYFD
ncbi:MAG: Gfo/Idh/MocA family oxidoreductase [Acutalibacter sp.]|nr:Gfo/Idh/MocA family oxidoreductase [Acutalibacter sp.]